MPAVSATRRVLWGLAAVWLLAAQSVRAASTWYEGFEGPNVSWTLAGADIQPRILAHNRVSGQGLTGQSAELFQFEADGGRVLHFGHDAGKPRVIEDLRITLQVRSDRPGLQLAAKVILPHTEDPRTGRPIATMLVGSTYTNAGRWQQLALEDTPRLLQRQVWTLRAQLRDPVDERGAYVEQVLLTVYPGPGATTLWIDDLDIAGHASAEVPGTPAIATATVSHMSGRWQPSSDASGVNGGAPAPAGNGSVAKRRVALSGSDLLVDGRPFLPRAVQYRGEPLELVRRIGFNTLWLEQPATAEMLTEAARVGLWFVCPPPVSPRLDLPNETAGLLASIGPEYGCVLAWDMGRGLTHEDLPNTRRWAEQVREADRAYGRPLVCSVIADLDSFSRTCDILVLDRRPLGASLELRDYARWLRERPRLAQPRTPLWTTIQTQPSPIVRQQLLALDSGRLPPATLPEEQIRLLCYTAISAGSRGIVALSDSPLSAGDADTQRRAASLELLNLEFEPIEPFAAGGKLIAPGESSEPEVLGAVLRTDRAALMLPIWTSPGAQWVPAQSAVNNLSLKVPGVPDATSAYELVPGGAPPLRHKREAGGTRVTLDEFGLTGAVLLAHDPLIITTVTRRAVGIGHRAAELQRTLATIKLQEVSDVVKRLPAGVQLPPQAAEWQAAATQAMEACRTKLAARDYPSACVEAGRSTRALRLIERAAWEAVTRPLPSPMSSPATVSFASLPWQAALDQRLTGSTWGQNILWGGDMEDLQGMVSNGWRHTQHSSPILQARAELAPRAAHGGRSGLRLIAQSADAKKAPALIDQPPVWISTAPVAVEAGQLVCVHGWVLVPQEITGSVDGLLVIDSLTGEALAERFGKTKGWRQFAMYRVAPQSGWLTVTFALAGLGEAWIDDVAVQIVHPAQ
ncbi:MAG: hypothetical protein ACOY3P_19530 [Planctomycetota bacterium]